MQYINIIIRHAAMPRFTTLLQSGIRLKSFTGSSIGKFLTSLPELDAEYLSERVQTIFIDGSAVDDLEKCFTGPTHVVALSAAMPGLAGAIFRRNSLFAALRSAAENQKKSSEEETEIEIRLKLFNMIALEKGPALLQQGGIFSGEVLAGFVQRNDILIDRILSVEVDGGTAAAAHLTDFLQHQEDYHTTIIPQDTPQP
ncbi:MAG: hypothetical protein ABR512_05905 [Desulfopila sp.]